MPNNYDHAFELGKGFRRILGSFAPSGAGISSAAGAVRGVGFTPSYVSTGVYRVTLNDPFKRLIRCNVSYQGQSADTDVVEVRVGDVNEANKTIDIVVFIAGSKANVTASGVAKRLNFEAVVATIDVPGAGASA